mmetsp:Transcript_39039/g.112146  ORF Transcript_39039/g.112146 Transcript_39039/m.112146 type:complete len:101 (+) Transcript_39039:75-377(+)
MPQENGVGAAILPDAAAAAREENPEQHRDEPESTVVDQGLGPEPTAEAGKEEDAAEEVDQERRRQGHIDPADAWAAELDAAAAVGSSPSSMGGSSPMHAG